VADQLQGSDGVPTWLAMLGSVISTILAWKAWQPLGAWLARRLEVSQQAQAAAQGNYVAQLVTELKAARAEMAELRQDLGEEKEIRMAVVAENVGLRRDVDHLTRQIAEDKRECQAAIRSLRTQIQQLQKQRGSP
jgi:septal ring factor EnvC (AmiA/AmiB activator)